MLVICPRFINERASGLKMPFVKRIYIFRADNFHQFTHNSWVSYNNMSRVSSSKLQITKQNLAFSIQNMSTLRRRQLLELRAQEVLCER